jgi:VanZ family protein
MMGFLGLLWLRPRGLWVDVLPAFLYLAVLFWAGLTPMRELPAPDFLAADKLWHLLAFGGLAALLSRALHHFGRNAVAAAREASLAACVLGALLELLQGLTSYRSRDIWDLIADTVGAALAFAILSLLRRGAARSTSSSQQVV